MEKTKTIDVVGPEGTVKKIELPACFAADIRTDLIRQVWQHHTAKQKQPHGAYALAGKEISAAGKTSHRRHVYKTLYGIGVSRVTRQVLSRRGERIYWKGALIPGTVGGRAAHPPKTARKILKINKKVRRLALRGAIAATASAEFVEGKYKKKLKAALPIVIDSIILSKKSREIVKFLSELLGKTITVKKKIRAGKGKRRGRKYKKSSKLLIVISSKENAKKLYIFGFDYASANQLSIQMLAPRGIPGRLVVWTEKAIEEIKSIKTL